MEQQLDQQAGMLLEEALAKRGVCCELASGITAIADDAVTLSDGRRIAATRVVLATGVQPNVALAKPAAFAARAASWWISRCKPPCRVSTPSASAAKLTARRLARWPLSGAGGYSCRAAGREVTAPFTLTDNGVRLKVTGVDLFSLGRATAQADDVVWSSWDPLTRHYRRLLIHQGRWLACC